MGRAIATTLAAGAASLTLLACGGDSAPGELGRKDVRTLVDAQSQLGDLLEQEETLRTDPAAARSQRARVQKVVSSGSFETARPDEFGIAMLGELRRYAPGLVQTRQSGDVYALDKPATRAFLRYAASDAPRALAIPVARQVKRIDDTVDHSDADGHTKVPPLDPSASGDETVSSYLRSVESDLRPRYRREATRLGTLRGDLGS